MYDDFGRWHSTEQANQSNRERAWLLERLVGFVHFQLLTQTERKIYDKQQVK